MVPRDGGARARGGGRPPALGDEAGEAEAEARTGEDDGSRRAEHHDVHRGACAIGLQPEPEVDERGGDEAAAEPPAGHE